MGSCPPLLAQTAMKTLSNAPRGGRSTWSMTPVHRLTSQRLQACPDGRCSPERCRHSHAALSRFAQTASSPQVIPPSVHEAIRSPGQPLDPAIRGSAESRFRHDFGHVRIHTDDRSARSAADVAASAYTVGRHIVFAADMYQPSSPVGRELIRHELVHVIQQSDADRPPREIAPAGDAREQEAQRLGRSGEDRSLLAPNFFTEDGPPTVRRLVRGSLVTCPAGQNPRNADRDASALLDNAIKRIQSAQAVRAANPAHPDVVATGQALRTAFGLDPSIEATWSGPAPNVRLPVILRRLQMAKSYVDSVVFTVNCLAAAGSHTIPGCGSGSCSPTTEAFSCHTNPTAIDLCPLFWTRSMDQQGRVWAHEVFHINFGVIDDWGQPDVHNAHCYAQFVALLFGINSPVGFRCH